jgi:hypothetical protein
VAYLIYKEVKCSKPLTQMTTYYSLTNTTMIMEKVLTKEEVQRVADLNRVWDYLYKEERFYFADIISREIGVIKGTLGYNECTGL